MIAFPNHDKASIRKYLHSGRFPCERRRMALGDMSLEDLQDFKREEAVERLRLLALGSSGAWIWPPNTRIVKVERPDERWLCELELARS